MPIPRSLRARLLLAFLVVIGATLGTVAVAALLVGPGYFVEAMGHLPGDPMGEAMGSATQAAFEEAMQRALIGATVIAIVSATVVSLAVAARIARPIGALAAAARRVADGHYAERVPVADPDELGELATSFNEMAGSLETTERRRLQLVGDVAHELRTPLTTLDGYLEGLEDGVIAPSEETWRLLRAETGRLTRLVNDLSELWRAEARQLPLRIETVDAAALAGEVVDRFRPLAAPRGVAPRPAGRAGDGPRRPRPRRPGARELPVERPAPRARRVGGHGRRRRPPTGAPRSASQTRVPASPTTSSRRSSSASTASMPPAAAPPAGPASGWRSCARSPAPWVGAPGRRAAAPGRAPPSCWSSRRPDLTRRP